MKNAATLFVMTLILGIGQMAQADEPLSRDQLRMAVQAICPVTGEKLGAHGDPVKMKVGEETVFLCCEACRKEKVNPQHWATIHANFATAQGVCLVMKRPLPENPKGTIVEGQIVYVCCPPCGKKITADSANYLKQLDERYAAWLRQAENREPR